MKTLVVILSNLRINKYLRLRKYCFAPYLDATSHPGSDIDNHLDRTSWLNLNNQSTYLQTNGRHHEKALAAHNRNIYSNLGGTTLATLSPRLKLFPLFLVLLLPRSHGNLPPRALVHDSARAPTPSRHHPIREFSPTGTTEASHQPPSTATQVHPDQPPSPNPTPPPPDDVAVLETHIDKVDFHINGIFENVGTFGLTLGGGVFNVVREGAMRHEKILTTPPTTPQTDTGTQTTPPTTPPTPKPKPTTNSVSTNTDPPPTRTYAEAATTTTSSSLRQPPTDKGKAPAKATPPPSTHPRTNQNPMRIGMGWNDTSNLLTNPPPMRVQAVVLHAAPTKYKPGLMRHWIEEDNKTVQIQGIRWFLKEDRRIGKLASSLVIYMTETIDLTHGLRMGRRLFRTTAYDWAR
ncbi:hypothetical protein BGX38DRAFT_1144485 [Terfezia claveryi]|nr:hypothetical protein BGX38DRAFT_1144485 [Terfezia claveryi]